MKYLIPETRFLMGFWSILVIHGHNMRKCDRYWTKWDPMNRLKIYNGIHMHLNRNLVDEIALKYVMPSLIYNLLLLIKDNGMQSYLIKTITCWFENCSFCISPTWIHLQTICCFLITVNESIFISCISVWTSHENYHHIQYIVHIPYYRNEVEMHA